MSVCFGVAVVVLGVTHAVATFERPRPPSNATHAASLLLSVPVPAAAVGNLRSEDYNLLIKSQLIGAPIGYWIGE